MHFLKITAFVPGILVVSMQQAFAQSKDIYELITTAIHTQRSETALPVTILSGDELQQVVRATLGDTLAGQPGISNASFGPAVGQTVIRGQQGRRVMNLTNGLPNADASGNSADHAQTVEAILATSIEVLRGPSTLLYGGGAIGGVVNVIDRRFSNSLPNAPSFALEARHDTAADTNTLVGSADFTSGALVWHLDGVQRNWNNLEIPGMAIDSRYLPESQSVLVSKGYIPNTAGDGDSATLGVSRIFSNGVIGLAINQQNNYYGLPAGVAESGDPAEPEDGVHIDMERTRYEVMSEWKNLAPWAEKLDYRASYTDYAHAEIEPSGEVGTQFSNESWQHRLQITHTDSADRHGVVGLQHSNEEFSALGEESFIPITDISSSGIFVVEDFHAMAATIEIGARLNRDDYQPQFQLAPSAAFTTTSLSASALWDISSRITTGLSVSRSQRAPSVEELYSNFGLTTVDDCIIHFATGSCEIGSSAFTEETSLNTDLTLNMDYGRFNSTLTVFYNRFNDYIGQVETGTLVDGFPVREYLQDDAHFHGLELDVNIELSSQYSMRLFGDVIRGAYDNNGAAPRMPPKRLGLELNYSAEQWSAHTTLTHAWTQNRPGLFEANTNSWTRLDAGVDYRISTGAGELLVFITGRNLGNQEIRLSTSYLREYAPEAGRSLETGIRYRY